MQRNFWVTLGFGLASLAAGCDKKPSATDSSAVAPVATGAALPVAAAKDSSPTAAPLSGLDPCVVGVWKGNHVSLKTDQVTAEGGANLALNIAPSGDSVLDFAAMSPIQGKGAGANFDFRYSGKASATLSTPTRGTMGSANTNYSGLRVSANVQIPGGGKIALLKDKPISELAQMVGGVAGAKAGTAPGGVAPAAAAPPGIDANPVFSNSRYSCEGDRLTFHGAADAGEWVFDRVRP